LKSAVARLSGAGATGNTPHLFREDLDIASKKGLVCELTGVRDHAVAPLTELSDGRVLEGQRRGERRWGERVFTCSSEHR
jgi:hypothetical protein